MNTLSNYDNYKRYLRAHLPEYPANDDDLAYTLTRISATACSRLLFTGLSISTCQRFAKAIGKLRYNLLIQHRYLLSTDSSIYVHTISSDSPNTVVDNINVFCSKYPYGTVIIDFDRMAHSKKNMEILSGLLKDIFANGTCGRASIEHNYFIILANQTHDSATHLLGNCIDFTFYFHRSVKPKQKQFPANHTSAKDSGHIFQEPVTHVNINKAKSLYKPVLLNNLSRDLKLYFNLFETGTPTEKKFVERYIINSLAHNPQAKDDNDNHDTDKNDDNNDSATKGTHDFGYALYALKHGHRVTRLKWKGFWFIPDGITLYYHGKKIQVPNTLHIIFAKLRNHQGYAPAMPYQVDMLANDWVVLKD